MQLDAHSTEIQAHVLIRTAHMDPSLFSVLTDEDRALLTGFMMNANRATAQDRTLSAEIRPMAEAPFTRGSYVLACTLAALAIVLPTLVAVLVHPAALLLFPIVLAMGNMVRVLTR